MMDKRSTALKFGPLEPYAHDTSITDVALTCDGKLWVDRGCGMQRVLPIVPLDNAQTQRMLAVQLCSQVGCRLDDACPIADGSSDDGIRIHAVIAPIVERGAAISIRFPRCDDMTLHALSCEGLCPSQCVDLLEYLVVRRANILITGATGCGKTTLLKALLMKCDATERIITVEEVRELGSLHHDDVVSLLVRQANVEGSGAIGLPQLVKATLRMRPDRVVVGECRGEEIIDMLRALNSGHRGSMTTLHANALEQVPARMVSLGLLAHLDPAATCALAAHAFDVVIHVKRLPDGRRIIAQMGYLEYHHEALIGRVAVSWDGIGPMVKECDWDSFCERVRYI